MAESAVGQRLKFLINELSLDIRGFCRALDVSETTVRNYFNRGSKPNADFLEKLSNSFPQVNLSWLLTGVGRLYLSDPTQANEQTPTYAPNTKNFSNTQIVKGSPNTTQQQGQATELVLAQKEIEHLRQQLEMQKALLAAKDETINALKGTHK